MNILFVCTGNSCRSVMAEYLFKKMMKAQNRTGLTIGSAGTHAVDGWEAAAEAINLVKEEGWDASKHHARRVTQELVDQADWILVMTQAQMEFLRKALQVPLHKLRLLRPEGVPDPIGESMLTYRSCAKMIKEGLNKFVEDVLSEKLPPSHS